GAVEGDTPSSEEQPASDLEYAEVAVGLHREPCSQGDVRRGSESDSIDGIGAREALPLERAVADRPGRVRSGAREPSVQIVRSRSQAHRADGRSAPRVPYYRCGRPLRADLE